MNLKRLRKAIDGIDADIVGLLNRRAEIIVKVAKVKAHKQSSIYLPHREAEVYRNLARNNRGPLPNDALRSIFSEVMSSALRLEKELVIAYLGPEITFTHMAAMKKFGSSVTYAGCGTITDVFAEVERGRADYGVVPIENSSEGAISHTLDMFIDADLKICAEIFLDISHSLLSKERDRSRIKKIYSKPEVFGQCRLWLEANMPGVILADAPSTARAAEIASRERSAACIASELAAKRYGLAILSRSIEDSAHNVTRFLVIGRQEAEPTRCDKTSIMLSVKDRVGALHDILVPFKKNKINLTKIESRPSKVRAWEYYFFVDVEGHHREKNVAKALAEIKRDSAYCKILGSYPVAD